MMALALASAQPASGAYIPPSGKFVAVDAGPDHWCAIRTNGTVECWGESLHGEAADPKGRFTAVAAGGNHSCGLKRDKTIVCWGEYTQFRPAGSFAMLSETCGLRPDATIDCWGIEPPATPGPFTALSAGGHACAIRSDATLACWGDDDAEELAPQGTFTAVSVGLAHSCAVGTDAALVCWGGEEFFEIPVLGTPPAGSFTSVSAGSTHSCALRTDRTIACWGDDSFDASTPPRGRFTAVSAGHVNTCAIRTNARLVCWGRDHGGAPLEPADAVTLPAARGCAGRRALTLRVNRLPGVTFTRVVVRVRGKRVKAIKRFKFSGSVRIAGVPRGRFKLSVTVFAIGKPPVTLARTYGRCGKAGPKRCGTVPIDHNEAGRWDGVVEVAYGGHPCSTAMSVAQTAAAEPFGIGDQLPAPNGWFCMGTFRPSVGSNTRYVLGCWQGERSGPPPDGYAIGVLYPTS